MLKLDKVRAGYGPIDVLKEISLHIDSGEIVTLIGANGAGKSTTLLTIAGLVTPRQGSIVWQGSSLLTLPAHIIVKRGICLTPEGRHIFPRLTVKENLLIGSYQKLTKNDSAKLEKAITYFPLLKERQSQLGGTLSGGEQQMLAIARALMSKPTILLMDEPSMGLAPLLVQEIFKIIERINKEEGVTILLV